MPIAVEQLHPHFMGEIGGVDLNRTNVSDGVAAVPEEMAA